MRVLKEEKEGGSQPHQQWRKEDNNEPSAKELHERDAGASVRRTVRINGNVPELDGRWLGLLGLVRLFHDTRELSLQQRNDPHQPPKPNERTKDRIKKTYPKLLQCFPLRLRELLCERVLRLFHLRLRRRLLLLPFFLCGNSGSAFSGRRVHGRRGCRLRHSSLRVGAAKESQDQDQGQGGRRRGTADGRDGALGLFPRLPWVG